VASEGEAEGERGETRAHVAYIVSRIAIVKLARDALLLSLSLSLSLSLIFTVP